MIINSSPLIIFGKLNKLELLSRVFNSIEISERVYDEAVEKGMKINASEAFLIKEYIKKEKIKIKKLNKIWKNKAKFFGKIYAQLDEGEAETISLALQEKEKPIIMDEKIARKVAELNGLSPIGSLGVLLIAFRKKIINEKEIKEIVRNISLSDFRLGVDVLEEFWTLFDRLKKEIRT